MNDGIFGIPVFPGFKGFHPALVVGLLNRSIGFIVDNLALNLSMKGLSFINLTLCRLQVIKSIIFVGGFIVFGVRYEPNQTTMIVLNGFTFIVNTVFTVQNSD